MNRPVSSTGVSLLARGPIGVAMQSGIFVRPNLKGFLLGGVIIMIFHLVLQQIEAKHEGVRLGVRVLGERRPVGRRHDLDDAGMALGGRHVEEGYAAARDAADRQHGMKHHHPGYTTLKTGVYEYKKQFRPLEGYDWASEEWKPWESFQGMAMPLS